MPPSPPRRNCSVHLLHVTSYPHKRVFRAIGHLFHASPQSSHCILHCPSPPQQGVWCHRHPLGCDAYGRGVFRGVMRSTGGWAGKARGEGRASGGREVRGAVRDGSDGWRGRGGGAEKEKDALHRLACLVSIQLLSAAHLTHLPNSHTSPSAPLFACSSHPLAARCGWLQALTWEAVSASPPPSVGLWD